MVRLNPKNNLLIINNYLYLDIDYFDIAKFFFLKQFFNLLIIYLLNQFFGCSGAAYSIGSWLENGHLKMIREGDEHTTCLLTSSPTLAVFVPTVSALYSCVN